MSQMYMVSYDVDFVDSREFGKVLVCASNADDAALKVRMFKNLQNNSTVTEVVRVKPSVYQVSSREFQKPKENPKSIIEKGPVGPSAPISTWRMSVVVELRGYEEAHAWRRFAAAVVDRASGSPREREPWIIDITMEAERAQDGPRPAAIEKQAIYSSTRVFAGGAARPR